MNTYQKIKERNLCKDDELLTHTDFDPKTEDRNLMNQIQYCLGKKPNHAGVGAFLSYCILPYVFNIGKTNENHQFLKIVLTVILRHHGAKTIEMSSYSVSEQSLKYFNKIITENLNSKFSVNNVKECPFKKNKGKNLAKMTIQFGDITESFMYFILVRLLRLCDQKSCEKNSCYMEGANG